MSTPIFEDVVVKRAWTWDLSQPFTTTLPRTFDTLTRGLAVVSRVFSTRPGSSAAHKHEARSRKQEVRSKAIRASGFGFRILSRTPNLKARALVLLVSPFLSFASMLSYSAPLLFAFLVPTPLSSI